MHAGNWSFLEDYSAAYKEKDEKDVSYQLLFVQNSLRSVRTNQQLHLFISDVHMSGLQGGDTTSK